MPKTTKVPVHTALAALLFVAFLLPAGASAQVVEKAGSSLPNLGDGAEMAPTVERRMGDRIARALYKDPDYVDDPVVMDYLQSLWQPLLAAARARGDLTHELESAYAWQLLLGRDRTVNAFALPGAYFGIHMGLVAVVGSRDELASVLAHELSHVTQRHIARMLSKQGAVAPWMVGAMVLGVLAASSSPQAASAMVVGGQAAAAQVQLNFSRDMEREADRVGFGVATQAGFAPQGFVSMFEKLQQASRLNDAGNFPYLRSHPLSTERMADMQGRVGVLQAPQATPAATLEHALVSARAKVLANSSVDALRAWDAESSPEALASRSPVQQAASLYGAALAASKLRNFPAAQAALARLQARVGADLAAQRLVQLLRAELALAQAKPSAALAALPANPGAARASLLLWAQAAAQAASPQASTQLSQASQALQSWVAEHPLDAGAWQQLATLYERQGRTLQAIRALAEVDVAQLDDAAALGRFQAAQAWARGQSAGAVDHIELSIVDTRVRLLEQRLREQAAERP